MHSGPPHQDTVPRGTERQFYFDKAKAEKVSFAKSKELLVNAKLNYTKLKNIEAKLNKIDSTTELDIIMKELKIKTNLKIFVTVKFNSFFL